MPEKSYLIPYQTDENCGETAKAMQMILSVESEGEITEVKEWLPKSVIETEDDKVWIPSWKVDQIEKKLSGGRLASVDSREE